jgi:hypothetical protein
MRIRLFIFLVFGPCIVGVSSTDAQVAGTYRLTICTTPCSGSDSGVVRGTLVLLRDSFRIDTIATSVRVALAGDDWLVRPGISVNACFALRRQQSRVDGRELYAGIVERSLTTWISNGRSARVRLYQSPDASYDLIGAFERDTYSGTGHQNDCCGGTSPSTFFRAVRVGDPDLKACLSV